MYVLVPCIGSLAGCKDSDFDCRGQDFSLGSFLGTRGNAGRKKYAESPWESTSYQHKLAAVGGSLLFDRSVPVVGGKVSIKRLASSLNLPLGSGGIYKEHWNGVLHEWIE